MSHRPTSWTVATLEAIERTENTVVRKRARSRADEHRDKSAAGDSKNENGQTPFGSFTSSNRGPISIQSDSLALDYKRNAVLFSGHVHATQADGALGSDTLNVKY